MRSWLILILLSHTRYISWNERLRSIPNWSYLIMIWCSICGGRYANINVEYTRDGVAQDWQEAQLEARLVQRLEDWFDALKQQLTDLIDGCYPLNPCPLEEDAKVEWPFT